ncbi:GAF domain nucleotide-binding protein [Obba rivulosa]|uniref:GAF domain nucleotide-binding protein n=1 Tax=Obba rivulosa TaxID=1052685 RepID=A0A8E2B4R1_9APHY|nr:GAF domain nucleotide-binding protein [Obba rivulosa]
MPHADSSYIPQGLSKTEFWVHVHDQLTSLLEGQRHWVTNLANASSLIYNALLAYTPHFGDGDRAVNWCGFYIDSPFFPTPRLSTPSPNDPINSNRLLLGPFCGKPACQLINVAPGKARGVCADAYVQRRTVLVHDVEQYPGHIACDGETKSEIVCPLIAKIGGQETVLGVLDLDCLTIAGFDEEDQAGLEKIANLVVNACDW